MLTPHSGELAGLLGVESDWVDAHRLEAVRRAVERFGCVVLLKGAETIVGAPDGQTLVSAGLPDARDRGHRRRPHRDPRRVPLEGHGRPPRRRRAAARAHADAAIAAPHFSGLIASDVIATLPDVLDAA